MSVLVDALVVQLRSAGVLLESGRTVDQLELRSKSIRIDDEVFDAVVISTDSGNAAQLVAPISADLASLLSEIRLVSTVTISLIYDLGDVPQSLHGHGYVIPRREDRPCLAMTWMSSKWANRVPPGRAMIRAFLGRAGDESWVHANDAIIAAAVREEAMRTLGIKATPERTIITRWPAAMPQYEIGHAQRIVAIETLLEAIPRLAIAGNFLRGIGIPDCVREGRKAATRLQDRVIALGD